MNFMSNIFYVYYMHFCSLEPIGIEQRDKMGENREMLACGHED